MHGIAFHAPRDLCVKPMKDNRSKIRKWINRDDGRCFQVGNYDLNGSEIVGMMLGVACLVGLALAKYTLDSRHQYISIGLGIIGLVVYAWGSYRNDKS